MRDGVTLVRIGKPVVVVVQGVFDKAAHVHAEGLGCADLPIVSYPHPSPGSAMGQEVLESLAGQIRAGVEEAIRGAAA